MSWIDSPGAHDNAVGTADLSLLGAHYGSALVFNDPVIPDDYSPLASGPIKMPEMNEATALQGLRLFREFTGQYPEDLSIMSLIRQIGKLTESDTPAAQALKDALKDNDQDSTSQKMIDTLMPLQATGAFYALLVQEKKDPAYHGDVVSPGDASQVLLRWKVSDTEYRVIFGDLTAETVAPDTLAKLEKTLPEKKP